MLSHNQFESDFKDQALVSSSKERQSSKLFRCHVKLNSNKRLSSSNNNRPNNKTSNEIETHIMHKLNRAQLWAMRIIMMRAAGG